MSVMSVIPLQPVPRQTLAVTLSGQACRIGVYQKSTGLFLDLAVNGQAVIGGVLCLNLARIVRDAYLGFAGDLVFYDAAGARDPDSAGLGTRFLLVYLGP